MGFCSFSTEYTQNMYTFIENQFILKYLPLADAKSLKVYLFGLYLCQNADNAYTLESMASTLQITTEEVLQAFLFWEDFDLLKIITKSPICVQFHPVNFTKGKPKKIQAEKYTDFTKALQALFPEKMISSSEYIKYFQFMEENALQPEAMLLIINYCISIKGKNIRSNYILQVAKDWLAEDIRTTCQIEEKLARYTLSHSQIQKVFEALHLKGQPKTQDIALFEKWIQSYQFSFDTILYVIESQKITSFAKLNTLLETLFKKQLNTLSSIQKYFTTLQQNRELTVAIAKTLGVYCQNIDTYLNTFLLKWKAFGFTDTNMLAIAKFAFYSGNKSFEEMNDIVEELHTNSCIDSESLEAFFAKEAVENDFLKELFKTCGLHKTPTARDREQLRQWRAWQFDDALLLKAATLSFGKQNAIAYINGILRSWKEKGIATLDAAIADTPTNYNKNTTEDREKDYRKKIENEYFFLREKAIAQAEYNLKQAEKIDGYKALERSIRTLEIEYSKAVALGQENANTLQTKLQALQKEKLNLLKTQNIDPKTLQPQFYCKVCNDTGFDKNNNYCKCYIQKLEKLKKNIE